MRILIVTPYPPYPVHSGAAARVFHLIRMLARAHRVTLLCFASTEERSALSPLREICATVHTVQHPPGRYRKRLYQIRSLVGRPYSFYRNYSPAMAQALDALLAREGFDIVQFEFGDAAPYYRAGGHALWVLDEHNVEYRLIEQSRHRERSRLRRLYNRVEARKLRREELAACRRADAILTVSDVDRATLAPEAPDVPIQLVPNGVDTVYF